MSAVLRGFAFRLGFFGWLVVPRGTHRVATPIRAWVLAVVAVTTGTAAVSAAQPELLLRISPGPVPAGAQIEATAFFLNKESDPISFLPPARISWHSVTTNGPVDGVLLPLLPAMPAGTLSSATHLQPGAFVAVPYAGPVPKGLTGSAYLEIPSLGNARFPIEITRAAPPLAEATGRGPAPAPPAPDVPPVNLKEHPGQTFFRRHFAGYDPVYFLWGPDSPNVKFQVSFRYRILNPDAELSRWWRWADGLNVAYTQTSLWDFDRPSAPFFDSSYKPEFMWRTEDLFPGTVSWWEHLGLQAGIQHESNGKDGPDSRSLNVMYLQPTFLFGDSERLFLSLSPRAWFYVGDLSDNPDIKDYRGYAGLSMKVGWGSSVQLAGLFRVGDDLDRANMQLDLTYPTARLFGNLDLYLHAQYFNGWGEGLLNYNERSWTFRVGVSLYR